jgi:transcriptional regulator of arginine metabolism
MTPRTAERTKRRQRLLELLQEGLAATQDEIVARLAKDGLRVTQATVSRDLEDLGAVRHRDGHRIVYTMPSSNGPPVGFGRRMLAELVIDAQASQNLVVVRTFPGMAPTVGAVLDQAGVDGVLGTVAGDDTVLVVADERTGGKALARKIKRLSGA